MNLSDVLDDIQSDLPDTPSTVHLPEDDTSPEKVNQAAGIVVDENSLALNLEYVQSLEAYKQYLVYRKAVESSETLSKSLATEIFAMLPDIDTKLLKSKLTSASSAHNKTLLIDQMDKYQTSVQSLIPMVESISVTIARAKETLEELEPIIKSVSIELQKEMDRTLKTSVVVFCHTQYDLWETPLKELSKFDDRLIDFPPYEGKLTSVICDIRHNPLGQRFIFDNTTMSQAVGVIISMHAALERVMTSLCRHSADLGSFDPERFGKEQFNVMLEDVEWVSAADMLFRTDTRLVDDFMKFVHLLK